MFVLSPGSTKRNGVVFISAHPLSLFCPLSSISRCSPPVPPAYHCLCLALLLLPCFHSTSKSIRLPAKPSLSTTSLPPSPLSSLDALSRTTYMATRSSPPRDFDSCLIHVARSFTCVRGFPRPLFHGRPLVKYVTPPCAYSERGKGVKEFRILLMISRRVDFDYLVVVSLFVISLISTCGEVQRRLSLQMFSDQ